MLRTARSSVTLLNRVMSASIIVLAILYAIARLGERERARSKSHSVAET